MYPFVATVPIYLHIPAVLGMLGLQIFQFRVFRKRIIELEGALNMRDVLLWDDGEAFGAHVAAGGTLVQTFQSPMWVSRLRITSKNATELQVEYDH